MLIWVLTAGFYLVLSAAATAASWRHHIAIVGLALICASAISTFGFFSATFDVRVLTELVLAWLIGIAASALWWTVPQNRRAYQVVLALCLVDVAFCGAICMRAIWYGRTPEALVTLFDWTVNVIFAAQCACVAAPGVRDAYVGWIRAIKRDRIVDGPDPDFDWLLRRLDGR